MSSTKALFTFSWVLFARGSEEAVSGTVAARREYVSSVRSIAIE
jgi:hypothetical protein